MDSELHKAILGGDLSVISNLVTRGAAINKLHGMKGTPLCAAIANNKLSVVKYFLQQDNCDVNAADYDGEPPLCLAINKGYTEIAKALINNNGCNLNILDPVQKKTALCIAVCEGNNEVVDYLVKAGCNLNKSPTSGTPAVHYAITDSRLDLVQLLVLSGASLAEFDSHGHNALHHSIYREEVKCTQLLLQLIERDVAKRSTIVDALTLIRNDSCLHIAVDVCSVELLDIMVKQQSDINVLNNQGQSALFVAIKNNATELVSRLLKAGADPDIEGQETVRGHYQSRPRKLSALHVAVSNGNLDIVKMLVESGTSVNVVDFRGNNSLMVALHHNKRQIAKYLLEQSGIDVLCKNQVDENCLFAAISCSDPAWFVQELVKRGCSVNQRNSENLTPLHLAVDNDCSEVSAVLLDNGSNVNALTNEDDSLLHFCASAGYTDIMRILLFYGADIDAVNEDGQSPLSLSIDCENYDTASLLLECGASAKSLIKASGSIEALIEEKVQDDEWHETLTKLLEHSLPVSKLVTLCRRSILAHFSKHNISLKNVSLLPVPNRTIRFLSFRL